MESKDLGKLKKDSIELIKTFEENKILENLNNTKKIPLFKKENSSKKDRCILHTIFSTKKDQNFNKEINLNLLSNFNENNSEAFSDQFFSDNNEEKFFSVFFQENESSFEKENIDKKKTVNLRILFTENTEKNFQNRSKQHLIYQKEKKNQRKENLIIKKMITKNLKKLINKLFQNFKKLYLNQNKKNDQFYEFLENIRKTSKKVSFNRKTVKKALNTNFPEKEDFCDIYIMQNKITNLENKLEKEIYCFIKIKSKIKEIDFFENNHVNESKIQIKENFLKSIKKRKKNLDEKIQIQKMKEKDFFQLKSNLLEKIKDLEENNLSLTKKLKKLNFLKNQYKNEKNNFNIIEKEYEDLIDKKKKYELFYEEKIFKICCKNEIISRKYLEQEIVNCIINNKKNDPKFKNLIFSIQKLI